MNAMFAVHKLNDTGLAKAEDIAHRFADLASRLETICPAGRERSILMTKLEEACFFAKKAMVADPANCDE